MAESNSQREKQTSVALARYARDVIWEATDIHTFWTSPDDPGKPINSDVLHYAAGIDPIDSLGTLLVRCRLGMLVEEKDAKAGVESYAHLIHYLEGRISNRSKTTRIDICPYKRRKSAIDALGRGEIDMLKIGGASFVVAVRNYPGIKPIVAQHPAKSGAIFVRRESGIDSLAKLHGKKIALGNISSTVSMWAIYRLAQSGVAPEKFLWTSVDGATNAGQGSKNNNEEPINAVLSGESEAGVINEKVLLTHSGHTQLKVVENYESFPVLWLARSDLPIELVDAVGSALTELRDPAMFEGLSDKVKSYKRVSPEETAVLHQVVTAVESVTGPLR